MSELTMPRENDVDWNALGQAIDTTFGRSSTTKSSSYSIKMSFKNGNQLLVSYTAVVNFGSENEKLHMKRRFEEESLAVVNDALKKVKKEYKDLAEKSVSLKEVGSDTAIELINVSPFSPRKTAYYRRKTLFDIS